MVFRINQTDIHSIEDMAQELKHFAAKFDDAAHDCQEESRIYADAFRAVRDILQEAAEQVKDQQPRLLDG